MKRSNDAVPKRLQKIPVSDVCNSVVTKSELLFGVEVSSRRRQDESALNAFLGYVEVPDFPDAASPHYAKIRAHLKTLGTMIGANDVFIAAHARSLGVTLVYKQHARVRTGPQIEHRTLDTHSLSLSGS